LPNSPAAKKIYPQVAAGLLIGSGTKQKSASTIKSMYFYYPRTGHLSRLV